MTVALNMIIGKWEEPFLEAAFWSVFPDLVNEVVFIDTAPDNNPNRTQLNIFQEIYNCGEHNPIKIIDMPRGEDKDFSFAAARELARVNTKSDWVLRLDADEIVHEKDIPILLKFVEEGNKYSSLEVSFYHFMVYPWLFQYIEPKEILFKKDNFHWEKGVHELPYVNGFQKKIHEIKYFHMGYCRGQAEVFKRWKLYTDIDGRPTWYNGVNPKTILDDRISVCQNFTGSFPKALEPTLDKMFPNWREIYE